MVSLFVALLLQGVGAGVAPADVSSPDTVSMSLAEVKAFNAKLGRDDPNYIRCRTVSVTGSLVKRGRVCRTNHEWTRLQEDGNEHARKTWEGGMICGGGPECRGN